MKKKLFMPATIILALLINLGAYAAEMSSPRYINISQLATAIQINSSGKATCSGSYVLYKNHNATIQIELQRSQDKKSWISETSWSRDFSATTLGSIERNYYISSGYYYRVVTTLKVKSGNTIVETATGTSQTQNY
ncbi:hypothetical protein [uncultured Robinsoniella sp.]|uniref:hypothetical protein n=1 Tax=uncultured Robinsoniella sp. TaxID=904190 RepID=UPI00374E65B2